MRQPQQLTFLVLSLASTTTAVLLLEPCEARHEGHPSEATLVVEMLRLDSRVSSLRRAAVQRCCGDGHMLVCCGWNHPFQRSCRREKQGRAPGGAAPAGIRCLLAEGR